jgi:hypothetical protein
VCESQRGQTGGSVRLIAKSIPRLLRGRAVITQAVGFDDEMQIGPVEVGFETVDAGTGKRLWKTSGAGKWEKAAFELGVDEVEGAPVEHFSHLANPGTSNQLSKGSAKLLGISEAELVRLVDRGLQGPSVEPRRQVDQRADRGRDWNAVVPRYVIAGEGRAPVDDDS